MQILFVTFLVALVAKHNGVQITTGIWVAFGIFAFGKLMVVIIEAVTDAITKREKK